MPPGFTVVVFPLCPNKHILERETSRESLTTAAGSLLASTSGDSEDGERKIFFFCTAEGIYIAENSSHGNTHSYG